MLLRWAPTLVMPTLYHCSKLSWERELQVGIFGTLQERFIIMRERGAASVTRFGIWFAPSVP